MKGATFLHGEPRETASVVGRRGELMVLEALLGEAIEGCGRLVLLSGPRGMGKTAVAIELARQAGRQGAAVLWASCAAAARGRILSPWGELLEQCASSVEEDALRELLGAGTAGMAAIAPATRNRLPDLPPLGAGPAPRDFATLDSVVRVLAHVARQTPLVVVLDDLHTAEVASLAALRVLAHEIRELPMLVLAAYREGELRSEQPLAGALAELGREPATLRLHLDGLDDGEVGQLVAMHAHAELSSRAASALHRCTGGNPLFVIELLRAVGLDGLRDLSAHAPMAVPMTPAIRAAVQGRLARLSDPCRRALRTAAMIGHRVSAAFVAAVIVEQDAAQAGSLRIAHLKATIALFEQGVAAGVVCPLSDGCYRFADWFTVNVLRQDLPVGDRVRVQRAVERALGRREVAGTCLGEWAPVSVAGAKGPSCSGCHDGMPSLAPEAPRHTPPPHLRLVVPAGGNSIEAEANRRDPARAATRRTGFFRKEGDYWTIGFDGLAGRMRESKGLRHLGHLLRHPRHAFLAVDLAALSSGGPLPGAAGDGVDALATRPVVSTTVEPLLDASARAACRARLAELRDDLAEAERHHDLGRAERARAEIDQLLSHWQESIGLGGRSRGAPSAIERARSAVTKRIRAEIRKIYDVNPSLGRHLAATILTGRTCSYEPDRDAAVVWEL